MDTLGRLQKEQDKSRKEILEAHAASVNERRDKLIKGLYNARKASIDMAINGLQEEVYMGTLENHADCVFLSSYHHNNLKVRLSQNMDSCDVYWKKYPRF